MTNAIRTLLRKLTPDDRALVIAFLNAGLSSQDGKIPNRLRIDHNTCELYQIFPVDEEAKGVAEILGPILTALKATKRRAA